MCFLSRRFLFESLVVAYIRSLKYAIWATARHRLVVVSSFLVAFCLAALLFPVRSFKDEIWATARRQLDVVSRISVVTTPLFSYASSRHCIKCLVFGFFSLFGTHGYLLLLSVMS